MLNIKYFSGFVSNLKKYLIFAVLFRGDQV
jgi:hypothetical protein